MKIMSFANDLIRSFTMRIHSLMLDISFDVMVAGYPSIGASIAVRDDNSLGLHIEIWKWWIGLSFHRPQIHEDGKAQRVVSHDFGLVFREPSNTHVVLKHKYDISEQYIVVVLDTDAMHESKLWHVLSYQETKELLEKWCDIKAITKDGPEPYVPWTVMPVRYFNKYLAT